PGLWPPLKHDLLECLDHIPVPQEAVTDRVTDRVDTAGLLKVGPEKHALGIRDDIAGAAGAAPAIRLREEMRPAGHRLVVVQRRLGPRSRRERTPRSKKPDDQESREDLLGHVTPPRVARLPIRCRCLISSLSSRLFPGSHS